MEWTEQLVSRIWHLRTIDGDVAGSITRLSPPDQGYRAWLRGPDPSGTVIGDAHATPKAAKQAVETALIARLAEGPKVTHDEPPPSRRRPRQRSAQRE